MQRLSKIILLALLLGAIGFFLPYVGCLIYQEKPSGNWLMLGLLLGLILGGAGGGLGIEYIKK